MVIDIDNHSKDKETIYNKFFNILPNNCVAERTGNMGIHVYLYNDLETKFSKNRFTKIIESIDWDIDIFLTADSTSENRVMVAGSRF